MDEDDYSYFYIVAILLLIKIIILIYLYILRRRRLQAIRHRTLVNEPQIVIVSGNGINTDQNIRYLFYCFCAYSLFVLLYSYVRA